MFKYENVTMLYGIAFIVVCALILGACGQDQGQVVIDSTNGVYFEVVMINGDHVLVPAAEVQFAERDNQGKWFMWKYDNTGFYGVDLVAYGKKAN